MRNRLDLAPLAQAAIKDFFEVYTPSADHIEVVGSSYIEGKDTSDIDVLVYVPFTNALGVPDNWTFGGSNSGGGDPRFHSYKAEIQGRIINMLVTQDIQFYLRWCEAADKCKLLHITDPGVERSMRIAIHDEYMGKP